jgi:hypothetical protein
MSTLAVLESTDLMGVILSFAFHWAGSSRSMGEVEGQTGFALVCKEWNTAWKRFFPMIHIIPVDFAFQCCKSSPDVLML